MRARRSGTLTRRAALALAASASLLLTACSAEGDAEVAEGESVPEGSDAAVYSSALEDVSVITLEWGGHTSGPTSPSAIAYEDYTDLLTETSGGKLEVVHDWGGAKVSGPEMAKAMQQGRIDLGTYIPTYAPDEWPVSNAFSKISSIERSDAIAARLAMHAARTEFAQTWEPLIEEHKRHGITPILPLYSMPSAIQLMCTDDTAPTTLAELQGKRVRVSSTSHEQTAQALGMVPVSLPTTELFNALQRGVVDCAAAGISGNIPTGVNEVTNSWVTAGPTGVNWTESPISWGISQRTWEDLPLAAQQLLWDSQQEHLRMQAAATNEAYVEAVEDARERGVDFGEYSAETSEVMADYLDSERAAVAEQLEADGIVEDGSATLAEYEALYDKWYKIVTEELGYPENINWPDLPGYVEKNGEIDFGPWADRVYQEVLLENRPG